MLYGETGAQPLICTIKQRILNFWAKLVHGKPEKFSSIIYRILLYDKTLNIEHQWLKNVENILNELGFTFVWESQNVYDLKWFLNATKLRICDQAKQNWYSSINDSPKCITYRIFKDTFCQENFLSILPKGSRIIFTRFRTTNHRLPIETGRWVNIERTQRKCSLCNENDLGDEYHYLFKCNYFSAQRQTYIDSYYYIRPNTLKFNQLFCSNDLDVLSKLCKFLSIIMNHFS